LAVWCDVVCFFWLFGATRRAFSWLFDATVAVDGVDGLVCFFWQDGRYIWHGG